MQAELCVLDDDGDVAVRVIELQAQSSLGDSLLRRDIGSSLRPLAGSVFVVRLVFVLFELYNIMLY